MSQNESELEMAEAEVSFWLDFASWWEAKHGEPIEPRIFEALAIAEKRYSDAKKSLCTVEHKNSIG